MRAFIGTNDLSGIFRRMAVIVVIAVWFTLLGAASGMADDFCKCDPFSREQSVSAAQTNSPSLQAPAKQLPKLQLMGGPRAEKLPTGIRSEKPEPILGVQGITTASNVHTQE